MSLIEYKVDRSEGDLDWIADDILEEETGFAKFAVGAGAFHLKEAMQRNVSGPGRGEPRRVTGFGVHRPSLPDDDFPAKFRGNLAKSIRYSTVRADDLGRRIRVQSHVAPTGSKAKGTIVVNASARVLEFGGFVGRGRKVRILPRSFIRVTVEQERARIEQILEQ